MCINVSDSCKIGCFVTRIVETFLPKVAPIPEKYLFLPAHIKADTRAAETHLNATLVDIEKKFPKYFFHAKYFITLLIKSNMPSTEVTLTWKFEEAFVTWLFSQFGILDKILFILLYHKTSLHFHVRSPREFRCFEIREGIRKNNWKIPFKISILCFEYFP